MTIDDCKRNFSIFVLSLPHIFLSKNILAGWAVLTKQR
ncbi:hypothetical protein D1AOALGA4SA_9722 [Olavius algarvensis Delta 1 endosymbiont]|nr:hypothetical protein D1AOALGA4SA_9722 [Olavius algarvensis Delta 1 endosymbiont]